LKRVLNVVLIAFEVAKCKLEVDDEFPEKVIALNPRWPEFSARLTKWIFLCELYPFRMSFLVQVLMDLEQKKIFNRNLFESWKEQVVGSTSDDSKKEEQADLRFGALVYYCDIETISTSTNNGNSVSGNDNLERLNEASLMLLDSNRMNIGEFFFLYVEKYLYTIASSEKLMRLDGDPELFATLLYSNIQLDRDRNISIRCVDILGPLQDLSSNGNNDDTSSSHVLLSDTMLRDKNFALMTYAFNLNPSMLKQIGMELQEITTQFELIRSIAGSGTTGDRKEVLLQGNKSVFNKREMLIKQAHQPHSYLSQPSFGISPQYSMKGPSSGRQGPFSALDQKAAPSSPLSKMASSKEISDTFAVRPFDEEVSMVRNPLNHHIHGYVESGEFDDPSSNQTV
jgi:hypothetical protein